MKIKELERSDKKTAIIAADLHLLKKPGMWSGRAEIAGDDLYSLQQIVKMTREREADLYLLGDTLDAVLNLPRPLVALQTLIEDLVKDGHRVRYIQGQHEIVVQAHYDNFPWLSICRGTEHLHGCAFEFLGKRAFALDYFPQSMEALQFSLIPKDTEILFLHGTAEEIFDMSPHFSLANLPTNVKMVYAGDYHEAVHKELDTGLTIVYTGSTWVRSASEPLDKSVLVVHGPYDWERVPLATRQVLRYSQLTPEQINGDVTIQNNLPEQLRKPVVIVDTPIVPEEYERLARNYHVHTVGSVITGQRFECINVGETFTDSQVLERYVDRSQYPDEFDFTLDVIGNPVSDCIKRLSDKLGISVDDVMVVSEPEPSCEINLEAADPVDSDAAPWE